MKRTAILVANVVAVAIILGSGLAVLPGSVQEAQANPCSVVREAKEFQYQVHPLQTMKARLKQNYSTVTSKASS